MDQIKYIKEISVGLLVIGMLLIAYFGVFRDTGGYDSEEGTVTLETLMEEDSLRVEGEGIEDDSKPLTVEETLQEEVNVVVDVKGAVKVPGVFSFGSDQRVIDAIDAAGGLADNADTKLINFAQLLEDEMYIYIPETGEDIIQQSSISEGQQTKETVVDINKADEAELLLLDGIGPSKAAEIIKYREENGPFQSIEELTNVTGIGEKTFERIKERIKVK